MGGGGAADGPSITDLALQVPLRPSQQRLVELVSSPDARSDQRLHVVSPPGSGKTLIGLELARQLGEPTVVFAPTTTIQQQWHDEVDLLLPAGLARSTYVSTDADRIAPVTVLTYQVLSTTADPDRDLVDLARRAWADELVVGNRAADVDDAERYLDALDPPVFRREVRARIRTLRRRLLTHEDIGIHHFLHTNARQLVDRIVAAGVATVILDECHHLLDHWAVVLADLISRLEQQRPGQVHVLGLTATLPSPGSAREQHNYEWLLGEVDAEIPTPAVVRDGALAPYRDLAVFVEPTAGEQRFLATARQAFDATVVQVAADDAFLDWLVGHATNPAVAHTHATVAGPDADSDHRLDAWGRWLRDDSKLAVAVLRAHQRFGLALPEGVPIPAAATEAFGTDDWLTLLERWVTGHLMLSGEPADRRRLQQVREALGGFGLTVTTRGIRHGRSPADVLLALSDAKAAGCAAILAREHAALGSRVRALVVTDVDTAVTAAARLRGVLDADAGTARRLHRHLVEADGGRDLDPVLVTGRTVRVGNTIADDLARDLTMWFARREIDASCRAIPVDDRVQQLVGEGPAWAPRHYVAGLTAMFAEGLTRCLVGTRALFGEGWDAPGCNVLVDLTAATTPTAQEQLRGRVLRLDPHWPEKVAHRWDVVCVARGTADGGGDLTRFVRRHAALWGISPADAPDGAAEVVRGVRHVDASLPRTLGGGGEVDVGALDAVTHRSLAAAADRDATRRAWRSGTISLHGAVTTRTQIRPTPAVTVVARSRPPDATALIGSGTAAATAAALAATTGNPVLLAAAGLLGATTAAAGWRWRHRRRRALTRTVGALLDGQATPDDLGALLAALADALRVALTGRRVLHPGAGTARAAVESVGGTFTVELVAGESALLSSDHHRFAAALRQLLGPIDEPRYLVVLSGRRPLALAVPDELGRNRDHAETFAAELRRHDRGVELVYTRSDEGARLLTQVWSQQRLPLTLDAFDRWT